MNQSEKEIDESGRGLEIESLYRIFTDMAETFTVKFRWKNEMAKILGSPDLQNDTMRCHLGIRLGLGKCKNGDFNDALSDLNRLSTLLDSVREDKCITGVKIETDAVQKLVLKG